MAESILLKFIGVYMNQMSDQEKLYPAQQQKFARFFFLYIFFSDYKSNLENLKI